LGNVSSVELDISENSSIPLRKTTVSRRASIDTCEKSGLGYGDFRNKTAIGAARAAIVGEHHSAMK